MDLREITALSSLISSAVQQLTTLTVSNGATYLPSDPTVRKYTLQITAAASQLVSLVQSPEQYVLQTAMSYHIPSSLQFAIEIGVAEILHENGQGENHALNVKDIAGFAHVSDVKLARILRLLATHHIFDEVAPNVFANNRLSTVLESGKTVSEVQARPDERYDGTSGFAALASHVVDDGMYHSTAMNKTLLDPVSSLSFSPLHAPFFRARNTELQMFDWFKLPENKSRFKRFGNAMNGMSQVIPGDAVLRGFDWSNLPPESVLIDVGGGVGAALLPIIRTCPNIRAIVQDSEAVVAEAPKFWQSHYPKALENERVSFQTQDFFVPQPISNIPASVFLIRLIMHDWPDNECLTILRHLRAASSPETKLVIIDQILTFACRSDDIQTTQRITKNEVPAPLLANWGAANMLAYAFDVMMMCNHNAGERTLDQFDELLSQSGWKIREVHQFDETWLPQIVAVPVS